MKKFLRFLLLAALMVPLGARAQSLTVANGTTTNSYVPIYGYYADATQHNQVIYADSLLTNMEGNYITALTYYLNPVATSAWGTTVTVKMGIVANSSISTMLPSDSLVQVWTGVVNGTEPTWTLVLDAPFQYVDGNLLVDITTTAANWSSAYFLGIYSETTPSIYEYNSYGYTSGSTENFLPMTTFMYNATGSVCRAPGAPVFDANTNTSLSFHWNHGGTENAWEVMVGDSLIENVTDTFIVVNDLNASSRYNVSVRSICGEGDTSVWSTSVVMITNCASIANLPWSTGFEGETDGETPLCWSIPANLSALDYYGDTTNFMYVYNSNYSSYNGNYMLYAYIYNGYGMAENGPGIMATPYFQHDPTDLHVTFYMASTNFPENVTFEAGVISDLSDTSTFVPLIQVTPNDLTIDYSYTYTQFEFYTSSLNLESTDSVCVAFRITRTEASPSFYFFIDDILVEEMGDCLAPTLNSGNIDSVSYEGVQLSWDCSADVDSYVVRLQNILNQNYSYYASADDSLLIESGLVPNTMYEAYVASICGDDTTSYTYIGSFTTHYRCYAVVNPEVVALTANAAALAWSYTNTGIEPVGTDIVLVDLTDSTVNPTTLTVTGTNSVFTGLTDGHIYQATFVTYCGESDTSWDESITFMPHTPPCAEFTGNDDNQYIPFYSFYNNGFSEMLYAGTDIVGVDTLHGISFEVATPLSRNNIIDIYMGYVSDSVTGITTTSYIPLSQLTHVVTDYSLNTANEGWTDVIPFDTAFATQSTGNLVIAVYNHTGSYASGLRFGVHTGTVGSSAYCYTDYTITLTDPYSSGNTSTTAYAPNIQLYGNCGGGDCVAPGVSVVSTTDNSVTLNWLPGGNESNWMVQYRQAGIPTWTSAGAATTVPYTVSGLNAGTVYQFRVGSDCGDTVVYSSAVNATTACGIMNAPFSIIPDGENNCWSYVGPGYSYNGYYIYNGGTIISPAIADSINTLQLRVSVHGDLYKVGVCNADASVVTWLDTINPGPSDEYHTIKTYLHNYSGTENHVIIQTVLTGYYYTYFDLISIEPLDNCMFVENLAVDSVTSSEAWLSWVSEGNNFQVSYMRESDTTATWSAPITTTTPSVHLTGLYSNDRYYVKVFNVCSATERSDSTMIRFATGCTNYTLPYRESFGMTELPVCWNTVPPTVAVNYTWQQTAGYGYNYIYSTSGSANNEYNDWVMTPNIQIPTDASNVKLIYLVGGGSQSYYSNSVASYQVLVSTTGNGDIANYTDTILFDTVETYDNSSYNYYLNYQRLSLAAYAGQSISIAFRNTSRQYGVVYLGTVEVRETVNPIYYVYGENTAFVGDTATFYASYQEGDMTNMNLQWSSSMASAGQAVMMGATTDTMSIVYSSDGIDTITFIATNNYGADTTRGLVYVYNCAPVSTFPFYESFETSEAPAGCWTLVYGDGNPSVNTMRHVTADESSNYGYLDAVHDGTRAFRFSSYSSSSDYNQYLISRELAGTNMTLSFWYRHGAYSASSVDNFRVGYSSTTRDTAAFTWGDWFENVSTSDWTQFTDSIPEGTKFVAIQYWGDYAYYIFIDDLVINGVGTLCEAPVLTSAATATETTATFSWASTADNFEVAIVEGAWVAPATGTAVADTTYTFSGLTASTMYTLGVRSVCSSDNTSEWVTRTVTTTEHPCYAPTNVAATNITMDGATIAWTPGEEGQTNFELRYSTAGDTTVVNVTENPYTLTGLLNATEYSVTVRAICGEGNYSDWSTPATFTTAACQMVQGVNVPAATITTSSAVVNWTANGSSSYEVGYGPLGTTTDNCTRRTTTTNSYTITGLEEGTNYVVYVRSICGDGIYSDWTAGFDFMTTEVGIDDVDNNAISLYPNPASSTVTLTGIEGEATVTVVDMNGRQVYSGNADNGSLTIDVTSMAQGAYFVRITGERVNAIRKLIVR